MDWGGEDGVLEKASRMNFRFEGISGRKENKMHGCGGFLCRWNKELRKTMLKLLNKKVKQKINRYNSFFGYLL